MRFPRVGIRLHGGMDPTGCVQFALAAERVGLSSVWFAENPFSGGVLPAVGASAAATREITIGIGVFNPFNRHPTLIAMEMSALDHLAGGRSALGLGVGLVRALKKAGFAFDKPMAAMRDAINIVRDLMQGKAVTYEGRVFSVNDVCLEIKPLRNEYPIYMAAMGDQSLRLAGEVSDGLMISNMCPPGFTKRALRLLDEGAAKEGRPRPKNVVQYMPCIARAEGTEARQAIKIVLAGMISNMWLAGERSPYVREAMVADSGIPQSDFQSALQAVKEGKPATEAIDDRFVDNYSVAGNADTCIKAISHFSEQGVTELVLTFAGSDPHSDMAYLGDAIKGMSR